MERCTNHPDLKAAPEATELLGARKYCLHCIRFLLGADFEPIDFAPILDEWPSFIEVLDA